MKKVIYLMTMVLALTLISTSCCKDDDPIPDVITVSQLEGDWGFSSFDFDVNGNGTIDVNEQFTIDNICSASELNAYTGWNWRALGFENVGTTSLTFTTECSTAEYDFAFTLTKVNSNYFLNIKMSASDTNIEYKFQILNTEGIGNELRIKLIEAKTTNNPIGGIYTLVK